MRVDALDRLSEIVYCGQGDVEAANLSKLVGVQLGYLQASESWWGECFRARATIEVAFFVSIFFFFFPFLFLDDAAP